MSTLEVTNPYVQILNLSGTGINNGSVYIGLPNQDPQTFPQAVFWDEALTISATQPLPTIGGYITRLGSPAKAYVGGAYSIRCRDGGGVQVFYDPLVGSTKPLTVTTNLQDPPFNMVPDGTTDNTAAFALTVTDAPGTVGATAFSAYKATYGNYASNGVSYPGYKGVSILGEGRPIFSALGSTVNIFEWLPDSNFTPGTRLLSGVKFEGNFVTNVVGLKIGATGATSTVAHATTRDFEVNDCHIGIYDYGTQISKRDNTIVYGNTLGLYIKADTTNGGGTVINYDRLDLFGNGVGMVVDNTGNRCIDTTCTMTNSSTALTNVVSTANIAIGDFVSGPGIVYGTKVASFVANTSITLDTATTSTAANNRVPILINNQVGFPMNGNVMSNSAIQASNRAAVALFGMQAFYGPFTFENVHMESNYQPITRSGTLSNSTSVVIDVPPNQDYFTGYLVSGTGIQAGTTVVSATPGSPGTMTLSLAATISAVSSLTLTPGPITFGARTVQAGIPVQLSNSGAILSNTSIGDLYTSAAIGMSAGSVVQLKDAVINGYVSGGYFDSAEIYGEFLGYNVWSAFIARWPDGFRCTNTFGAMGVSENILSSSVPNEYCANGAINPRVPPLSVTTLATVSTVIDAQRGPVSKSLFANSAGSTSANSIYFNTLPNGVVIGDTVVVMMDVRADSYHNIGYTQQGTSANGTLPITPLWRRMLVSAQVQTTAGGGQNFQFYPVDALQAINLYICNLRPVRVPAGTSLSSMQAMVRDGQWNDGNQGGALKGVATGVTPGAIAAGAIYTGPAVSVPGVRVGDIVASTAYSSYNAGLQWWGVVSANDTVQTFAENQTASPITPTAAGSVTVFVNGATWN